MYAALFLLCFCSSVGAGLPAMDVNDDAGCLNVRGVPVFFASRLAPTGKRVQLWSGRLSGRLALALAFEVYAPSRGRVEVLRSGQPGMDAGLAAYGHGWPIAAGPRSRTGARECRALARHRTSGARALGYLGLFQVTRCKSGTVSGRDHSNGYVHKKRRQTQSHRKQAYSRRRPANQPFPYAWPGNLSSAHNPPPSRLLKVNAPPIAIASCWAIANPNPVPPVLRLREFSTR